MTLAETIYKRKSTKKFDLAPLDEATLAEIKAYADALEPLYDGSRARLHFLLNSEVNCMMGKAPHYIAASSQVTDSYVENVGFMLQQMDLKLQSMGIGSHWIGMASPKKKPEGYVFTLAFGKAAESMYRELSDFDRKPLSGISDISDKRLEPARLAPSGLNKQPWYFISKPSGDIHAYCAKPKGLMAMMGDKMSRIGMGIAIAHLYAANPDTFMFFKQAEPKPIDGYTYTGSVKI
jgi:nitroreductase